jgi:hypothetical protein
MPLASTSSFAASAKDWLTGVEDPHAAASAGGEWPQALIARAPTMTTAAEATVRADGEAVDATDSEQRDLRMRVGPLLGGERVM